MSDPSQTHPIRDMLECLNFAAGIITSGGILVALWQLRLMKKDMGIKYKRESIASAFAQVRQFEELLKTIAVEHNHCALVENPPIQARAWKLTNFKFDASSIAEKTDAGKWLQAVRSSKDRFYTSVTICNGFESFALPFIKGVADESAAYEATGAAFCNFIEMFSPLLIHLRHHTGGTCGKYTNAIALYEMWAHRANQDAGGHAASIPVHAITPLGNDA